MSRWLTPAAFTVVAIGVAWHNASATDTWIVFPFLEGLVGPSPQALSDATVALLGGLAVLTGVGAWWRGRRADDDEVR